MKITTPLWTGADLANSPLWHFGLSLAGASKHAFCGKRAWLLHSGIAIQRCTSPRRSDKFSFEATRFSIDTLHVRSTRTL